MAAICIEVEGIRLDAQRGEVRRVLRGAVIGGKDDQRVVQPHLRLDMRQQVRQRVIQSPQVVLGLQTGWPEQVSHVIRGRQADGEVIRHRVAPELFRIVERAIELGIYSPPSRPLPPANLALGPDMKN